MPNRTMPIVNFVTLMNEGKAFFCRETFAVDKMRLDILGQGGLHRAMMAIESHLTEVEKSLLTNAAICHAMIDYLHKAGPAFPKSSRVTFDEGILNGIEDALLTRPFPSENAAQFIGSLNLNSLLGEESPLIRKLQKICDALQTRPQEELSFERDKQGKIVKAVSKPVEYGTSYIKTRTAADFVVDDNPWNHDSRIIRFVQTAAGWKGTIHPYETPNLISCAGNG